MGHPAVTQTQVRDGLTITPVQAQQMYNDLDQNGGWSGVETQTTQAVSSVVIQSGGGHPILEQAIAHPGIARLLNVAFCEVAAEVYGVVGSGAELAGLLGASLFLPGVGTAVAIIGLGIGALSIAGVC